MNLEQLCAEYDAGKSRDFLFFWGHTPKQEGVIDASCLSNWFPAPFEHEGRRYPTTEHYMMAGKAMLFDDELMLEKILAAPTPKTAKSLGRKVQGFDDATWRAHRDEIVAEGNLAKFSQHEEMGLFLLGTGEKVLVEASPMDKIWGIGLKMSDARAYDPRQWQGQNRLGFVLMQVRSRLLELKAA